MGTYRMYADENDVSTWEGIDLESHKEWLDGIDAKNIKFGIRPPDVEQDWHPAPARQFVIILSGQLQIRYEDGSMAVRQESTQEPPSELSQIAHSSLEDLEGGAK